LHLHPITQLLLFAAILIFGSDLAWLISLGKSAYGSYDRLAAMPPADALNLFLPLISQPIQSIAYGLGVLVFAAWTEVLARILASLVRLNAQVVES
jgi:hypothetical protein